VKRRDRQPVETRAGVYCMSHWKLPPFVCGAGLLWGPVWPLLLC
jgi:hypothetical protein